MSEIIHIYEVNPALVEYYLAKTINISFVVFAVVCVYFVYYVTNKMRKSLKSLDILEKKMAKIQIDFDNMKENNLLLELEVKVYIDTELNKVLQDIDRIELWCKNMLSISREQSEKIEDLEFMDNILENHIVPQLDANFGTISDDVNRILQILEDDYKTRCNLSEKIDSVVLNIDSEIGRIDNVLKRTGLQMTCVELDMDKLYEQQNKNIVVKVPNRSKKSSMYEDTMVNNNLKSKL